jgi:hypothetical protein
MGIEESEKADKVSKSVHGRRMRLSSVHGIESMTYSEIRRLLRLHERAQQHACESKKLAGNPGSQSKALWHMKRSQALCLQVSAMIRKTSQNIT